METFVIILTTVVTIIFFVGMRIMWHLIGQLREDEIMTYVEERADSAPKKIMVGAVTSLMILGAIIASVGLAFLWYIVITGQYTTAF